MSATGFYLLTFVMLFSPLVITQGTTAPGRVRTGYIVGIALWLTYILVLSKSGVLLDFGLPPRFPLMIVIPAIVSIVYMTSRQWFREMLDNTPAHALIYVQSFRIIVELLIFSAATNGIFPMRATFEGLNFDIVVGISSLVIGFFAHKKLIGHRGILAWNLVSLCILTVTVYSFIGTYYFSDYLLTNSNRGFVQMPYILLGSILLPYAVFFHVSSIRQQLAVSGRGVSQQVA